jgi:hypothetical protein
MPISGMFRSHAFGPEEIKVITIAFEETLRELNLVDRTDPKATLVAQKMIEIAQRGERNPVRLREQTLQELWS